ncbi:MAG TPA: ABC transporter substrate-binding protein [Verrucomicrobiae bacterium]|nr:ABC transporter substrate-binding protein [Verrucomicrobiae bacterium]
MKPRVLTGRWSVGALAIGLIVGACTPAASPSSPAASQPTGSAAAPSESGPAASVATGQGGTLSIAWNSDIQYFDPAKGYDVVSWPAERLIYEQLLGYDTGTKLQPLLADGMPTVSADGKAYTVKIHSGVKFVKPDGSVLREMNADDVVASFNRVLDPKLKPSASPVSSAFFGNIVGANDVIGGKAETASGIKKIDDLTVEFDLVTADATFLNILATPFASIVPKETVHDSAEVAKSPIGTGPYVLKDYTKGTQATFVANKNYWQTGQPYLDEIDFKVGVDDNAAIQQIEADQLDMMGDPLPAGSFTQITTDPKYKDQLVTHTLVDTDYLFMDTQQPNNGPLSKPAVRQALEYAIDKDNILKLVHGAGVKADCIFPPDMPGFDANCHPYTFDQAKAKQMLADAGYPNGFESHLYTDTTDPDPSIAQALQQDLAAVGVKVDITTEEFATFLDRIETPHKAPLGWVGWFQDYPDPSDFIDPILSCASAVQGGANAALYCNKDVDALAKAARGETDNAKRLQEYQQIQTMIMADAPWVPVRHQVWFTLVSTRVANFQIHPVWQYDLRNVQLKPGS